MRTDNPTNVLGAFRKATDQVLPKIIRQTSENFRVGRIVSHNTYSRKASVQLDRTNETLNNIAYPKGITDIKKGNLCIVFSPDAKSRLRNYIIAIY